MDKAPPYAEVHTNTSTRGRVVGYTDYVPTYPPASTSSSDIRGTVVVISTMGDDKSPEALARHSVIG
jgi:hypothetical protein